MKTKITIAALFLCFFCKGLLAQPLVYNTENTGASCTPPPLPTIGQLPVITPLPDPFLWANPSRPRSTSFSDWECHRNEFKAQIENYEIGIKPPRPDSITASYTATSATAGTLSVIIKRSGQTMTLTCAVALPSVAGPWPAVIGMNSSSGSVPATVFTSRNIVRITYSHDQVTTYGNPALTNPFYRLYPEYNLVNAGQYSAWAWGVSRIIDGLELVQATLPVKLDKIGVTGCSYAGKMALYSGAFDERIALTIAQESGGGGAPAWRASHNLEPNGTVEKIDNTDYRWFRDSMMLFSGDNVYKLPEDHHELMAMVAPRALLVTGNTGFTWLSNQANYVTSRATKSIYATLGISDRFGFYIDGDHNHCAVPTAQVPAMQAFVDKFLADIPNVITDTMTVNPFPLVNYQRWYQWWGTGNPVLPELPGRKIWLEAECATVGSSWNIMSDTSASGGKYVSVKSGLSSTATAPAGDSSYLVIPFTTDSAASYSFMARLSANVGEDYSYWMKLDNGAYQTISSVLATNGGFENGLTGWTTLNSNGATISADNLAADAHTGNGSMKVVNPTAQTGNQWKVQVSSTAFPTTIGKQYTVSYWVRAASPGGSIRLSSGPTSAQYQGDQTIGTAWQQVSWTITAALTSTTFLFDMGQVANTYYIDDASVKEAGSGGGSWQWIKLMDANVSVGSHTLTLAYRDGNAKLDKMLITTYSTIITGLGDAASNACVVCTNPVSSRLYVNATNLPGGNGSGWGCAYNQLYDAFAYANTHPAVSEIWITGGTYKPRDNGNQGENFNLQRNGLRIVGGFAGTEITESQANPIANPTILSGDVGVVGNTADNVARLFLLRNLQGSGPLVFKGLTMQDGRAGDVGGVAYAAYVSDILFDSCRFSNNYGGTGGAFYLDNTNASFRYCTFANNTASVGGAIYSFQSTPQIEKTLFMMNSATVGGAYYGNLGNPMFKDVMFYKNTASDGGAVYQNQMNATYLNCVLDSNMAANFGGGVYLHNGGMARMVNGTLFSNMAGNSGGAVYAGYNNPAVMVDNTIFWRNRRGGSEVVAGSDVGLTSMSSPMSFRYSMLQNGTMVPADNGGLLINNMRGISPLFRSEGNPIGPDNTWFTQDDGLQLTCGGGGICSPAVNSGDNVVMSSYGLVSDPTNSARVVCGTVDRGAYELQSCATPSITAIDAKSAPVSGMLMAAVSKESYAATGLVSNPFRNELEVRYTGVGKATMNIVGTAGKVIASCSMESNGVQRFDASGWAGGLYLVTITTADKKVVTLKAIKL